MRILLLVLCTMGVLPSWSQIGGAAPTQSNPFMQDANGRPLYLIQEYTAEGSPFYYGEYCLANIESVAGKKYKDVRIRLNLLENQIIYEAPDGKEFVATTPVRSVTFYGLVLDGKSFEPVTLTALDTPLNTKGVPVYELHTDGKAKLLSRVDLSFSDSKGYGTATITRSFRRKSTLYALFGDGMRAPAKLGKNKSDVLGLFGKDGAVVASFIEANNLSYRSQADLKRVFSYYNSL